MCLTLRLVIKVLFLLGCQTLYVMFQLSQDVHQLPGRLHTLSFRPSGEHWPEEVEWLGIILKDGPTILSHILDCWDDSLSLWLYSYLMTIYWCWVPFIVGVLCKVLIWFSELCVFSSFVIIALRKRELIALHLLFPECHCSLPLPHGTTGWSVVCDRGISCSYSLTFWHTQTNTVMSHLTNHFISIGTIQAILH